MIRKVLLSILLLVIMFYHIFPQGISIPIVGYSFIFLSGALGLTIIMINYLNHNTFFPEYIKLLFSYFPIIIICFFTAFMNHVNDPYLIETGKSLLAWLFSAYFIAVVFFRIYPKGSIQILCCFIVAAIVLQGIITIAMYMNPAVDSFFTSLMKMDEVTRLKREEYRGQRLLGYGTAFFGAGLIYGVGLILIVFVLMTQKLSLVKKLLLAATYAFVFYVGLLNARTTMIGGAASIGLFALIFFFDKQKQITGGQVFIVLGSVIGLLTVGYTVSMLYFPEFSDWAFEAFTNYQETGELRTESSDALYEMFIFPQKMSVWIYGDGHILGFRGTDVGFSRLLLFFGVPGTLAFFFFQFMVMKISFTKFKALNFTMFVLFIYNLALNVKGLSDLNSFTFIIMSYLLYYKYYVYKPPMRMLNFKGKEYSYKYKSVTNARKYN